MYAVVNIQAPEEAHPIVKFAVPAGLNNIANQTTLAFRQPIAKLTIAIRPSVGCGSSQPC